MNERTFSVPKKTLFAIIIIEILIIGIVGTIMFMKIPPREVISPDISAWESRITTFEDGTWHVDESMVSEEETEEETDLIYGPFMSLPAGCYSVSVDYTCDDHQSFEIYSFENSNRILMHEEETLRPGKESVTCHFTLLSAVNDLEVRVRYNGTGSLDVSSINITPSTFLLREVLIWLVAAAFLLDICLHIIYSDKHNDISENGSRMRWIDVCRGFGIILVLLGHENPPFEWLIFGFHIPLFFILSGYLYKDTYDTASYIRKNFRRYIIPYFALCSVNLIITLITTAVEDEVTSEWVIRYVRDIIYCGEWLPNCLPLWFLPAIFVTMTLMNILHRTKDMPVRITMLAVCVVSSVFIDKLDCPDLPWCIGEALIGLVLAECGYLLHKYNVIEKIRGIRPRGRAGLMIIMLVCGVNAVWMNHESSGEIVSVRAMRFDNFFLWIIGAMLLSVFVMSAAASLKIRSGHILAPLEVLGRNTILFFAFDFCMTRYALDILEKVLDYEPWPFSFVIKLILLIILHFIVYSCARKWDIIRLVFGLNKSRN